MVICLEPKERKTNKNKEKSLALFAVAYTVHEFDFASKVKQKNYWEKRIKWDLAVVEIL